MVTRGLIVHFHDYTLPGGVNKVVSESLKHLPDHDIQVDLAQPFPPSGDINGNFRILDECFTGRIGLLFNVSKFVNRVVDVAKRRDYSFVVIHGHLTTAGHRIAARIQGDVGKLVLHPHYDEYIETKWARPLFPIFNRIIRFAALGKYDNLIFSSEFEKRAFIRDIGKTKMSVIPLGVDTHPGNRVRKITNRLDIVYSGHLLKRKRIDVTIQVLSELSKIENISPKLKIIGDGEVKEELMRLSEDLKVSELIEWRGFLPKAEMLNQISNSDVFMLFSESEAFCITVAECLAMGTPCIVANHTALSEHAGENGCFLVDYPVDPINVVQKVKSIIGMELNVGLSGKRVKHWRDVIQSYSRIYTN